MSQQAHPKGLYLLFGVEMWERFSYYGMRALLMLYMTKALMFSTQEAGSVYGWYTGLVYLTPLLGGYLADRYLGQRSAILIGGILMALGHFAMAFEALPIFYLALGLLILGNGFFKPNISTVVGQLYEKNDPRRDGAYTIFYMGINLGAFFSPLVCGYLGETIGWHYGFAAAGVGMVAGLIMYVWGAQKYLGDHGLKPRAADVSKNHVAAQPLSSGTKSVLTVILSLTGAGVLGHVLGYWNHGFTAAVLGVVGSTFVSVRGQSNLSTADKQRVAVIYVLTAFSVFFWSAFEQAGSSLTLFADRSTDRVIPWLGGWEMPASWFQSLNPLFIFILAPMFSSLWIGLAKRGLNPSGPVKFALALVLLALGFAIMIPASNLFLTSGAVGIYWLTGVYLLHTLGELCLSPVGLSVVNRLAPAQFASLLMGVWLTGSSLANYVGGLFAGEYDSMDPATFFMIPTATAAVSGMVLYLISPVLKRWMHEEVDARNA